MQHRSSTVYEITKCYLNNIEMFLSLYTEQLLSLFLNIACDMKDL